MDHRKPEVFANLLKCLFATVGKRTGENMAQLAASVTPEGPERKAFYNWLRRASSEGVKFVHGGNRQKLDALLARLFAISGKTTWSDEELFETPAPDFVRQYEEARTAYEDRRGKLEWIKTHEPKLYWTFALTSSEGEANSYIHEILSESPSMAEVVHHMKWQAAHITHTFTWAEPWPDLSEDWWQKFTQIYPSEAALYDLKLGREKVLDNIDALIRRRKSLLLRLDDDCAEAFRQWQILKRFAPSPIGEDENEETPDGS